MSRTTRRSPLLGIRRIALAPALLTALAGSSLAQTHAIRFNVIDYSPFLKEMGVAGMYVGLGYEQNIDEYLAVTLEANTHFVNEDFSGGDYFVGNGNGSGYVSFGYDLKYPWKELAWRAKYFFSGNDDVSWYFSSGVGYRRANIKWQIFGTDYQNVAVPATLRDGEYQEGFSIFPLGFRLGHRSELDGIYADYFIGINFNLGSVEPSDPVLKDYIVYHELSSMNVCFGLNFGVGW
jgi:hypothetical protein